MYCKMDVDDILVHPKQWRKIKCNCSSIPEKPKYDFGCFCNICNSQCKECIGFGYVNPPKKKVHKIINSIKSSICMYNKNYRRPPKYIRINPSDLNILIRKVKNESKDHWINEYLNLGPPIRIFDIIVVPDRRKFR